LPEIARKILPLDGKEVRLIYRSNRRIKRLSLKITQFGEVELLIPPGYPIYRAENFLRSHLGLIEKRIKAHPNPGKKFTFWGREMQIKFTPGKHKRRISLTFADDILEVESNPANDVSEDWIYKKFLKIKAEERILPLASHIAENQGFKPSVIKLTRGTTRWGSCTSKGVVSLNFMLAALSQELIEYVIIHEFCHLRHLNRSPAFWNEVGKYVPDYKIVRKKLKGLML